VKIRKPDNSNILAFKFSPSSLPKIFSTWFTYGHSELKAKKQNRKAL
jgi:hypothetical protein